MQLLVLRDAYFERVRLNLVILPAPLSKGASCQYRRNEILGNCDARERNAAMSVDYGTRLDANM